MNIGSNKIHSVYLGNTKINKAYIGDVMVYASEKRFVPSWTISGSGWTNTTWGQWGVGRDEGEPLTGIAKATVDLEGHTKMRLVPTSSGWNTARAGGGINILIDGTSVWSIGQEQSVSEPVVIDISDFHGTVELQIRLSASWGYTTMYNETEILLFD